MPIDDADDLADAAKAEAKADAREDEKIERREKLRKRAIEICNKDKDFVDRQRQIELLEDEQEEAVEYVIDSLEYDEKQAKSGVE